MCYFLIYFYILFMCTSNKSSQSKIRPCTFIYQSPLRIIIRRGVLAVSLLNKKAKSYLPFRDPLSVTNLTNLSKQRGERFPMVTTRSQKRKKDEKKKKHHAKMSTSTIFIIYVVISGLTMQSFRDLQTDRTFSQNVFERRFEQLSRQQQIFRFGSYGRLLGSQQYQQVSVRYHSS